MKHILRASMAMVALLFLSCINTEDPVQNATVRLRLTGGIAVNQPSDATRAVQDSESLNVESLRVLIFNGGQLVSNTPNLPFSKDGSGDHWIISIADGNYVDARYGQNDVYVVLNEAAAGLTAQLDAVQTKAEMEALRQGKVEYTNLIAVNDTEEPAFIMCVHDEVTIDATKTTLDLTGLAESSYGFPMRRTMAKVVLESVVGGVDLNNTIVGTSTPWDGNASTDQIPNDTNNDDLIATSAVHILGLDLVNVPTHYSWQQDEYPATNKYPTSPTTYRADPIPVAQYTGQNSSEYFSRIWDGSISASGIVPFTRMDNLFSIWKTKANQGGQAYAIISEEDALNNPDNYYIWGITGNADFPTPAPDLTISKDEANKVGYTHYTMDSDGYIHLWNNNTEILTAPQGQFLFNSGNFISWFQDNYNASSGNFTPGTPVAGAPEGVAATIDPAVWELNFNNQSYYIPENINTDASKQTKLRITASIAVPTAKLDPKAVEEAIKALGDDAVGELVQDEAKLNMTDTGNILKYMYAKGTMVPHPTKTGYYALVYAGLSRVYTGKVTVKATEGNGQYDAITGMNAQKVTIEVPLNNADANDHNIYRGHEYRVKLYVTKKSSANWTPVAEANRSVTYHELPLMATRGGESDLCIAAEVIATPVE